MNNLTLRDPTLFSSYSNNAPAASEDIDLSAEFLSGAHDFQPFAEPPETHDGTLTATFLSGNHFNAQVNLAIQLDGNMAAEFLQGQHFLALPSTTDEQDQGAGQTAEFLSGDHILTLIDDPQFEPGSAPSDDATGTAEFLIGEHREIRIATPATEDAITFGADFLSGSYDQVNPGTGLEENEVIVRFTAATNSFSGTVTYSEVDALSESTFSQPFTNQPNVTYTITSHVGGILTFNTNFFGGAVDSLYARIFTLALPPNVIIPPSVNRGGVTGADADQGTVTCEFLDGDYFEKLIINPLITDESTVSATAEFLSGDHPEILLLSDETDATEGTMTAEFLSGLHEEFVLILDVAEDSEGTVTAEFLTGSHFLPGGDHPFVDSAITMDTTLFKADNGEFTADDDLASPSVDNTLYTVDEEY